MLLFRVFNAEVGSAGYYLQFLYFYVNSLIMRNLFLAEDKSRHLRARHNYC